MTTIAALKAASSLKDLAIILGLPPAALAYTLYKIPADKKYTVFKIPKKSGGEREISAPIDRLKGVQIYLKDVLVACRAEIESATPGKKLVSHAFRADGSILTNARVHRGKRYVFNLDIQDFFPSLNFGRVRGYFIKNKHFGLNPDVATVIAQIACNGDVLPQGSPSSPIISDLLGGILDAYLIRLAKRFSCSYSRYADDLTFSTNKEVFPPEISVELDSVPGVWVPGNDLLYEIYRSGFSINHKKTRMQYRGSRQMVTGLTVNTRINVRPEYYRSARAMCNSLFQTGQYVRPETVADAAGNLQSGSLTELEGIVNHIYFVKRAEQERLGIVPDFLDKSRKWTDREGAEKLYSRFITHKKFVALEKPLIIAEGKTDNAYLRAAIKRSPAYHGILGQIQNGIFQNSIQFFKHSKLSRELVGLDSSSSYFPRFISEYEKRVTSFKYGPRKHPVILLIDNDDGAGPVFGALKNFNIAVNHNTKALFYHVIRNLYVIKTPEKGVGGFSQIEDLFDFKTLATTLGGKSFNKSNETDTASEYGKAIFAEAVVGPKLETIDFSGFAPLLDRIVAVINQHKKVVAAGVA